MYMLPTVQENASQESNFEPLSSRRTRRNVSVQNYRNLAGVVSPSSEQVESEPEWEPIDEDQKEDVCVCFVAFSFVLFSGRR